ncbi:MAG: hypothetical protein PHX34_01210 [Candidatus Shapirobacteria bacterium]|nr:hypothetical protein [Candidatus Shapirobacteria bacterium]
METSLVKQILNEWIPNDLSLDDKIIFLAEKVRDIPYGVVDSRDPYDVYKNNMGTCSGKHELLKELYHNLGIKTQDYIVMHRFKDFSVIYPPNLMTILNRSDIIDPHNFFKIYQNNKWVIVDITWDKPLKKLGFIFNENWDGKTDMSITVKPIEIIQTDHPLQMKEEKLTLLSKSTQNDRKLFLKELSQWLSSQR